MIGLEIVSIAVTDGVLRESQDATGLINRLRVVLSEKFDQEDDIMDKREKQFRNNLDFILGGYENSMLDYPEQFPQLSKDAVLDMVKSEIFDLKNDGCGWTQYGEGICEDLKFLGNDNMDRIIIKEAIKSGVIEDE